MKYIMEMAVKESAGIWTWLVGIGKNNEVHIGGPSSRYAKRFKDMESAISWFNKNFEGGYNEDLVEIHGVTRGQKIYAKNT